MFDPAIVAADVDAKRRAGRPIEARDALHAALPYAPTDPALCFAGGTLYMSLGYGREATRFLEVVEKSGHPALAKQATQLLGQIAAEGTTGARDAAICVVSLAEVWRTMMTPYARQWSYAHWEGSTLADPCWVLNPTHLTGYVTGGHMAPPGNPFAWWTVRYAIEALDPSAVGKALGGRFAPGEILVYLETPTAGLSFETPTDRHRLGTLAPERVTAFEAVTAPVEVSRISRVYVAGRVVDIPMVL